MAEPLDFEPRGPLGHQRAADPDGWCHRPDELPRAGGHPERSLTLSRPLPYATAAAPLGIAIGVVAVAAVIGSVTD